MGGTSGFMNTGAPQKGGAHDDSWCGPNARGLEQRASGGDKDLLPFVAKFGHFFSAAFLTRRLFETLNSESDPAHAGFRRACDVLWPLYARGLSHVIAEPTSASTASAEIATEAGSSGPSTARSDDDGGTRYRHISHRLPIRRVLHDARRAA